MTQLRTLPKDLDGIYEKNLSGSSNPNHLKQFLLWLAFSKRALTTEELADVITVDFAKRDSPSYSPNRRYFSPEDMLDQCSSFITRHDGKSRNDWWQISLIRELSRNREVVTHVRQRLPYLRAHQRWSSFLF